MIQRDDINSPSHSKGEITGGDMERLESFGSTLILGGGQGKRIGFDKKNIEVGGTKLIDVHIEKLKMVFTQILVSSNTEFVRKNVTTLPDSIGAGPLAGIYEGLIHCKSNYLFIIACDMPFLSLKYIEFLKAQITNALQAKYKIMSNLQLQPKIDVIVMEREDGFLEPFNAFYHKSCAGQIKSALESGNYKVAPVLKKLEKIIVPHNIATDFSDQPDLFFNINYLEDLQAIPTHN
ncbi:MAG: molybdenum cofactor guanylyltransferase [Termitinemataceae bacterium]|nr:MAG: molybdenum cofactor guanylyltransferase [Termitinemataceae bacterium]